METKNRNGGIGIRGHCSGHIIGKKVHLEHTEVLHPPRDAFKSNKAINMQYFFRTTTCLAYSSSPFWGEVEAKTIPIFCEDVTEDVEIRTSR